MLTGVYLGGSKLARYLDNYPFPYYLVVQSVEELPEVLSDALTQWFEMINSRSDCCVCWKQGTSMIRV